MGKGEARRRQIDAFADLILFCGIAVIRGKTGFNGLGYIFAAYVLFYLAWVLCGKGAASVIARMLRGKGNRTKYRNPFSVKGRILIIQALSGLMGSIVLAFGGRLIFGNVWNIPKGGTVVMVLAPALFLRCVSECYCGFIRGGGKEILSAVCSVLRSVLYLLFAILLCTKLKEYGDKVGALLLQEQISGLYAALGVALAIDLTEGLLLLVMFVFDKLIPIQKLIGTRVTEPVSEIAASIYLGRAEQIMTGLLALFPFMTGMSVFAVQQVENSLAEELGIFTGCFLILMLVIIKLQDITILPLSAQMNVYSRRKDLKIDRTIFEYGFHAICVWGLYYVMLFAVFSSEWAGVLQIPEPEKTSRYYMVGAFVFLFSGVALFLGRLLYISEKRMMLLGNLGFMNAVFVLATSLSMNKMEDPIEAVLFSMVLTSGILCITEGGCVLHITGIGVDWLQMLVIPVTAILLIGLLMHFAAGILLPHVGNLNTILVCAFLSFFLYLALLVLVRNIREPEFEFFPGGSVLGFLGRLFSI